MNPLFQQMMGGQNDFLSRLNELKSRGGDPNRMIQELLNSGKVSQSQYNSAVQRANQIMSMLAPGGRR